MKPKLTKKALKMINEAMFLMLRNPHRYNQNTGAVPKLKGGGCGSAGCVYGFFGLAAKTSASSGWGLRSQVNEILGQDVAYAGIWHESHWPTEYQYLFMWATSAEERALVAVARVRHWMRTGK